MLSGFDTSTCDVYKLMLKKLSYSNECVLGLLSVDFSVVSVISCVQDNFFVHVLCPFDFKIVANPEKDSLYTTWKFSERD